MGPFRVLVRTAPDTCRLDKPATWRVFPEFDVERLRPCPRRTDLLGGVSGAGQPPPAAGPDSVPEHEVQELLKFKCTPAVRGWHGRLRAVDRPPTLLPGGAATADPRCPVGNEREDRLEDKTAVPVSDTGLPGERDWQCRIVKRSRLVMSITPFSCLNCSAPFV